MSRTGERIFGLVAIVVGLVLAFLAGIEADIHPIGLILITVGVIGWSPTTSSSSGPRSPA